MFLKEKELTALVKDAYKRGRLTISNFESDIIISSGVWAAQIGKKVLPRKTLAKIYELAGELPEKNEQNTYGKVTVSIPKNDDLDRWEKLFDVNGRKEHYGMTKIVIKNPRYEMRIVTNGDGKKCLYNEDYIQAVGVNDDLYGPYGRNADESAIIWYDDDCIFLVEPAKDEEELINELKNIELPRKDEFMGW
jgi:hypothetical protein